MWDHLGGVQYWLREWDFDHHSYFSRCPWTKAPRCLSGKAAQPAEAGCDRMKTWFTLGMGSAFRPQEPQDQHPSFGFWNTRSNYPQNSLSVQQSQNFNTVQNHETGGRSGILIPCRPFFFVWMSSCFFLWSTKNHVCCPKTRNGLLGKHRHPKKSGADLRKKTPRAMGLKSCTSKWPCGLMVWFPWYPGHQTCHARFFLVTMGKPPFLSGITS